MNAPLSGPRFKPPSLPFIKLSVGLIVSAAKQAMLQDRWLHCGEKETEALKREQIARRPQSIYVDSGHLLFVSSASIHFLLVTPPPFASGNHLPSTLNPCGGSGSNTACT